jgi:signal transduction histidine kinase
MADIYSPPVATASATASGRSELSSLRVVACLASAFLVCFFVVVAVKTTRAHGLIAALWAAGGVGVVGWLKGPRTREFDLSYGLIVAAAFAIGNVLVRNTPENVALFTVANMIEVYGAVWLIRRFSPVIELASLRGLTRFLLAAPVIAPLPAALITATGLALGSGADFRETLETWWFGHALGLAVIAPFGLALTRQTLATFRRPQRAVEALGVLGATVFVAYMVFFHSYKPIGFLVTPLLLLAAVRMRLLGATTAILIITVAAIAGVLAGLGPMHLVPEAALADKIRLMQLYLIFGCLPALPVAAILDENDRLAEAARGGQARAEAASAGKSRLLANVSHEIKSPVGGIIGIGELWAAGKLGEDPAAQSEMATMLVRTARQIEALAHDLLDVARAEAGTVSVTLRSVDLDALVEDVRQSVAVKPEAARVRWIVEGRERRSLARADSVRLTQVVTNLVTNAVKYGASGEVVILRLSAPGAGRIRLEVIDRGPGIPPERQGELFEPFNRLGMEKSAVEGHGIGLTLARRLTELQGGTLDFESRPGEGARFWIDLPEAED